MPRPTPAVPTDLQELSGRFEDWRRTRRGKLAIPEPLWAAAAELARSHGVCQTAQVLRLEYKKLKRLTAGEAAVSRSGDVLRRRQHLWNWHRRRPRQLSVSSSWKGHGASCASSGKGRPRPTWPDLAAYCGSRRDSDHAADAGPGGDRGGGRKEGHRLTRPIVPGEAPVRSLLWLPVRVSQPARHVDPRLGL
jgi:hypothetical protein